MNAADRTIASLTKTASLAEKAYLRAYPMGTKESRQDVVDTRKRLKAKRRTLDDVEDDIIRDERQQARKGGMSKQEIKNRWGPTLLTKKASVLVVESFWRELREIAG